MKHSSLHFNISINENRIPQQTSLPEMLPEAKTQEEQEHRGETGTYAAELLCGNVSLLKVGKEK